MGLVSPVARRHNVQPNQLFAWRTRAAFQDINPRTSSSARNCKPECVRSLRSNSNSGGFYRGRRRKAEQELAINRSVVSALVERIYSRSEEHTLELMSLMSISYAV